MLLHIVFAGERLVAFRAVSIFPSSVLLGVASGVPRGGEIVAASVLLGHGARVAVLFWPRVDRSGWWGGDVLLRHLGAVVGLLIEHGAKNVGVLVLEVLGLHLVVRQAAVGHAVLGHVKILLLRIIWR